MTTLVALSALNVAPATAAGSDKVLIQLASRVMEVWREVAVLCAGLTPLEEAVIEWVRSNPFPEWQPDPDAHELALRVWKRRKRAVERRCGLTSAEQVRDAANDRYDALRDELIETVPATLAGLRAKAIAARFCEDRELQIAVAFDTTEMFGGYAPDNLAKLKKAA